MWFSHDLGMSFSSSIFSNLAPLFLAFFLSHNTNWCSRSKCNATFISLTSPAIFPFHHLQIHSVWNCLTLLPAESIFHLWLTGYPGSICALNALSPHLYSVSSARMKLPWLLFYYCMALNSQLLLLHLCCWMWSQCADPCFGTGDPFGKLSQSLTFHTYSTTFPTTFSWLSSYLFGMLHRKASVCSSQIPDFLSFLFHNNIRLRFSL